MPVDRDKVYTHHEPNKTTESMYSDVRELGKAFSEYLDNIPDCKEKEMAEIKIQEATMWANAAIARNL